MYKRYEADCGCDLSILSQFDNSNFRQHYVTFMGQVPIHLTQQQPAQALQPVVAKASIWSRYI